MIKDDIDGNNEFSNAFSDIFSLKEKSQEEFHNMETKVNPRNIFVVHGRNHQVRDAMFEFLRSIDLRPVEWDEAIRATGEGSPTIAGILEAGFSMAQAAIILMTPDDEAKLRDDLLEDYDGDDERMLTPQPRPNVIFEAGMAMGKYPERTILVVLGKLRGMSDISGRHVVRISDTPEMRRSLASRLETANCSVNLNGNDWLRAGNFNFSKNNQSSSPTFPANPVGENDARKKSNNLGIKRVFRDFEKDEFKREAYKFITKYFESSLNELKNTNSNTNFSFNQVDANHFSATVYIDDFKVNACSIKLDAVDYLGRGIVFSQGKLLISGASDFLSVTDDGHQLLLKPLLFSTSSSSKKLLSIEEAAEHFWSRFLEPLQR